VRDLVPGKTALDAVTLEELEDRLLMADLGVKATTHIIDTLRSELRHGEKDDPERILAVLRETLTGILKPVDQPLQLPFDQQPGPCVILVTGVNGAGKTTSIGKLAHFYRQQGHSVMLAAGDTFRAAAVEQLQKWGERNNVPVVAQHKNADSAAVIYDGLQSARSKDIDILIADTAGRLHTQGNLMEELKKVRRVIEKFDSNIEPECLLVLDAGTGQNALMQTRQFNEAIGVTGLMLTKLDGTAKGGIIFALAMETGIPVRFLGVGEQLDDMQVFNSEEFVNALLD
ncbi:MAG TPA: signal recognition particle-docking protein FtsY, partial [Gammaproteobacteria bacterium]|nr:signal recognition particle-docking protein FtsY [Gammaproteobacteria bacterium]